MNLIITFLLVLTSFCFSQDFWEQTYSDEEFYLFSMVINANGNIFGACGTNNILRSLDYGESWELLNNGLPTEPSSEFFSLAINSHGDLFAGGEPGLYRSEDNGESWTKLELLQENSSWINCIAINKNDHIFIDSDYGIYRSVNDGSSWTKLAAYAHSIEINSDGDIFAVAYKNIMLSTDNGDTWEEIGKELTSGGLAEINCLVINSDGVLFAGTRPNGIFRSVDNGNIWSNINFNLPYNDESTYFRYSIDHLIINSNDDIFVTNGEYGIYFSEKDVNNWTERNDGLYSFLRDGEKLYGAIETLAIDNEDVIFAYLYGGGVYRTINPTNIALTENKQPSEFTLNQNYPNPFNPSTTIKYSIPNVGNENFRPVQLIIYDVLGREVATLVNKEQKSGNYEVEWNAVNNSSGVYFYKILAGDFVETKKMLLLR